MDEAEYLRLESQRMTFLRRKLLDELAEGSRILVYKRQPPLTDTEALDLFGKLRLLGPNRLLVVSVAADADKVGTVDVIREGLCRGHVRKFATLANGPDFEPGPWLSICRTAAELLGRLKGEDYPFGLAGHLADRSDMRLAAPHRVKELRSPNSVYTDRGFFE